MLNLPKMRTLPEAARELKDQDPKTCLTLPVLRRMVKTGVIPCVHSGKRALIDMGTIGLYLQNHAQQIPSTPADGKIRRIAE